MSLMSKAVKLAAITLAGAGVYQLGKRDGDISEFSEKLRETAQSAAIKYVAQDPTPTLNSYVAKLDRSFREMHFDAMAATDPLGDPHSMHTIVSGNNRSFDFKPQAFDLQVGFASALVGEAEGLLQYSPAMTDGQKVVLKHSANKIGSYVDYLQVIANAAVERGSLSSSSDEFMQLSEIKEKLKPFEALN